MIGVPEKDLRHMGHIGYDGAVFGDVSFIGNSYDKLPVKVASPGNETLQILFIFDGEFEWGVGGASVA